MQAKLSISEGKKIIFLSSAGFPLANMFWPLNSDSDPKQGSLIVVVINWTLTVELTAFRAGIAWNICYSEWVSSDYQSGGANPCQIIDYRPWWPLQHSHTDFVPDSAACSSWGHDGLHWQPSPMTTRIGPASHIWLLMAFTNESHRVRIVGQSS